MIVWIKYAIKISMLQSVTYTISKTIPEPTTVSYVTNVAIYVSFELVKYWLSLDG